MHVCVETFLPCSPGVAKRLALDPDLHVRTAGLTNERVVERTGEGPLRLGDEVTFEATHFGVRWRLTSRIVEEGEDFFVDRMVRGPLAEFVHRHEFHAASKGCQMRDVLDFASPLGPLGRIADRLFVGPHLRRFLTRRGEALASLTPCID